MNVKDKRPISFQHPLIRTANCKAKEHNVQLNCYLAIIKHEITFGIFHLTELKVTCALSQYACWVIDNVHCIMSVHDPLTIENYSV